MKIALFLLALVVSALTDNNNQCNLNTGSPGTACLATNQCALGLSCISGQCSQVTLGQSCTADTQCGGLYPFCISGRCDAKRIPGDPCSTNAQCISGVCSGTCIAKQLNEACSGSDCASGLYCNPSTRVCSNKIAVGAACTNEYTAMVSNIAFAHDLTTMCADSALCDFIITTSGNRTAVCTPIFSSTTNCGAYGAFTCPVGSNCISNNCQSIVNLSNDDNSCGGSRQCSGISTFCSCGNQNFQVYTSSNQIPQTSSRQLGASANTGGASANVGQTGASVNTQSAAVGVGQNGAVVGTQGTTVQTGQTGATVSTQGAAVGVGQNGAVVGTQGTTVTVPGTTTGATITLNNNGQCRTDNCLQSLAPDYYSCLLQNGCGLASEPVFINGTCASSCAFLYSRIKCCQAGFQPLATNQGSNSNNNNNNNNNMSLQRSVALPNEVQCVSFQQTQLESSAGTLEAAILVTGSLITALLF